MVVCLLNSTSLTLAVEEGDILNTEYSNGALSVRLKSQAGILWI